MDYKIVATLGPGSNHVEVWEGMLSTGINVFRLNTSHLSLQSLQQWLERLAGFLYRRSNEIGIVLDLQGSKWRLGDFPTCELSIGQTIDFIHQKTAGTENGSSRLELPVPHIDFFTAAPSSNGEVVLNDAKSLLAVESCSSERISARVVRGGMISAHKGITFRSSNFRSESLSEKDEAIIGLVNGLDNVQFAISYIKDAVEMQRYRELIGPASYLVAKLERGSAMADAVEISRSVNEVWVCRGDLGAELGLVEMARAVARFSENVATLPVPAFMAGQVLEHMTNEPTPTRSEVCYLLDCLMKGYRGFVLSDEAAVGKYPVESCRTAAMFRNVE
jgi:pyruvate kinase